MCAQRALNYQLIIFPIKDLRYDKVCVTSRDVSNDQSVEGFRLIPFNHYTISITDQLVAVRKSTVWLVTPSLDTPRVKSFT